MKGRAANKKSNGGTSLWNREGGGILLVLVGVLFVLAAGMTHQLGGPDACVSRRSSSGSQRPLL